MLHCTLRLSIVFIFIIIHSFLAKALERETFFEKHNFEKKEIEKRGEWLYGQDIIQNKLMPSITNIKIPYYVILDKDNLSSEVAKIISTFPKQDYAVKYSLYDVNSFSYEGIRGANSSRSRRISFTDLNTDLGVTKLFNYISDAPKTSKHVILQELIDQTNGFLFHAEFYKDFIELDVLWENSTGRVFTKFCGDKIEEYESIPGVGLSSQTKTFIVSLSKTINKVNNILSSFYGDVYWAIEGFYYHNIDQVTIFQLRPKPYRKLIQKRNVASKNIIYSTNFSYGNYNIGPIKLKDLFKNKNIFLQSSPSYVDIHPNIKESIVSKNSVLVIDPYRGFVLSHEKWFLPQYNKDRDYYSFIYIPTETLLKYADKNVRVYSSENKGFVSIEED